MSTYRRRMEPPASLPLRFWRAVLAPFRFVLDVIRQPWGTPMPVFVTRKTADGYTGSVSVPILLPVLACLLVLFNVIVWGIVGLVVAVRVLA